MRPGRDLLVVLALVALALAAPTFQTERPYSREAKADVAERLPVRERLAYAALSDMRLIDVKMSQEKVEKGDDGETRIVQDRAPRFEPLSSSAYLDCVRGQHFDPGLWKDIDPGAFVLSIAAAENYNRHFLRRRTEAAVDRLAGLVGLDLNPSLGMTQIRARRARELIAARMPVPLNRGEVADFLDDDCNALRVTGWWFEGALADMAKAGVAPTVENLALRYNGGTGYHASEFPYPMVVAAAYQMLQQTLGPLRDAGEASAATDATLDAAACFDLDEWGKAVTARRYIALQDGETRALSRSEFLAMTDGEGLRYAVVTPSGWTGSVGRKLRARVDDLVGVESGLWRGRKVEAIAAERVFELCATDIDADSGANRAVAMLAREGTPRATSADL